MPKLRENEIFDLRAKESLERRASPHDEPCAHNLFPRLFLAVASLSLLLTGQALHDSADSTIYLLTQISARASRALPSWYLKIREMLKCLQRIHDSISLFDKSLRSTERRVPMDILRRMMRVPKPEDAERDCSICLLSCYDEEENPQVPSPSSSNELKSDVEQSASSNVAPIEVDPVVFLGCGHSFHFSCAEEWLHRNSTCPNCRSAVLEEEA